MSSKQQPWRSQLEQAVYMITTQRGIHGEIIQKKFPADGVIYVRLYDDTGNEEWSLVEPGIDYDSAYSILQRPANRLRDGETRGF